MAEEQNNTVPVEAQPTTASEPVTEPTTASTEAAESETLRANNVMTSTEPPLVASKTETDAPAAQGDDAEAQPAETANPEIAGPQATTEVNAPEGDGTVEAATAPDASATPGSSKDKKRRSSAGVPEHKGKKLNKKKSMPQLNLDIQPGDLLWARMKGHPNWPAICCDEDMLPEALLASRPISTKRVDGTYREDFLEGGKNARDRTYPVMFLATNEFAWMVNTALTRLDKEELEGAKTAKMSKALQEAYEIAKEDHDLDYFKKMLADYQQAAKEAEEQRLQKEAEKEAAAAEKKEKAEKAKAEKATKKSRKSNAGLDGAEMDIDATPKSSKKRKKEADSEGEGKPKKTPKSIKLSAGKTPNGESAKKKSKKTVTKPKSEGEEDGAEAAEEITEAQKLERREKAVLYLRHRLQKGLLARDQAPKEEEMADMSQYFTQLEGYADLEPQIIRVTKIHKVLRAVLKLSSIPKDEEFNFKKRSTELLDAWNAAIEGNAAPAESTPAATNGETKAESAAPAATEESANAEEKADETKGDSAEKELTKEPASAPVETTEPGNDAKDEADVTMTDAKEDKPAETEAAEKAAEAPASTTEETAAA